MIVNLYLNTAFLRFCNIEKLEMNVFSKISPCWFDSYLKASQFLDISSRVMKTATKFSFVIGYQ